jgi:hypothetical protein
MLLKEKLEDQAMKKVELDRAVVAKKLELMKVLQQKLVRVGRTDDKLDREVGVLEAQMAEWQALDDANRPKAKRAGGLHVIKDGSGAANPRATAQKVD